MRPLGNLNGSFFTCSVPILKCGKSWFNWRCRQSPVKSLGAEEAEGSLCVYEIISEVFQEKIKSGTLFREQQP